MSIYITSDTHFFHKNIISYCNRPFKSVEEMNYVMIDNWNKTVSPEDEIWHLGDVCLLDEDKISKFIARLNGHKKLIMGNHDEKYSPKQWRDMGFEEVYPYPIIYKKFYIFSHEPVFLNEKIPYANVHGHLHQNKMAGHCYISVCVENTNYTPINIESIIPKE
jgi:calcineurin-like phosphoesterase family protein